MGVRAYVGVCVLHDAAFLFVLSVPLVMPACEPDDFVLTRPSVYFSRVSELLDGSRICLDSCMA